MAAVTIHSDFGTQENKICWCLCFSPSICHEVMGQDDMILVFWMLSFKSAFLLSSFTLTKRLFSFSLLYAIRVGVIFIPEVIDISPSNLDSSLLFMQLVFCMMYSAYKLNKQGENIYPWHTPFHYLEPVHCSMSNCNCCFLPCIKFSQETSKVVLYSYLFKNFPQFVVTHSQRL